MAVIGEPQGAEGRPTVMRTRLAPLAAVVAFALVVTMVGLMAGRGGDDDLIKLPTGASGAQGAEDAAASTDARSAVAYPDLGQIEYRVEGQLPALTDTAPAYRLGSDATREEVSGLATALGLEAEVLEQGGAWVARDGDRELRVERHPGLPWYLGPACADTPVSSDGAEGGVSCVSHGSVRPSGSASATDVDPGCAEGSGGCVEPAPIAPPPAPAPTSDPPTAPASAVAPKEIPSATPCPPGTECVVDDGCPPDARCAGWAPYPLPTPSEKPPRPADLPSRDEAEEVARAAFTRLGLDLDGFALEDGWLTWEARVQPHVGGLRVLGLGASLSIGPKAEIERANGFLARPDRIGDYPLVGVEKGLERLRANVGIGPRPLVAHDMAPFPPGAEPARPTDATTSVGSAEAVVEAPMPVTTAPMGGAPAVGECSEPGTNCEPPSAAPPPPGTPVPSDPPTVPPEPLPEPQPVVRTITGVHLALMQVDALLVPVYVFELEPDEEAFPVPAVTDEWLEQEVSAKSD